MSDMLDRGTSAMTGLLQRWAERHCAAGARIEGVRRMPGHSGISFGFDIVAADGSREGIVMRLPPAGVRIKNSTDVLRLVPLLQAMTAAGIPVPAVRYHGADETWFGVPYLMVERVAGGTLPDVFDMEPGTEPPAELVTDVFRQAVDALVAIHLVDAEELLQQHWAVPMSQQADIDMWIPMLQKLEEQSLLQQGLELRDRLLATAPRSPAPGVVHGDFYSNNWMFDNSRLTAVLDWENSTLGPQMWDLGWLATMYDPECWGPSRTRIMSWTPDVETLLGWYEQSSGWRLDSPDWYRALMCYRLACITPVNLRLHRTGRRVDHVWEVFGEAMPMLFQRARDLLRGSG